MTWQKTKLTFGTGCAVNRDMFYLSSTLDELEKSEDNPVSRLVFYQHQTADKWLFHDLSGWRVVSTCFPTPAPSSVRKIYALSEQGDVECYSREGSVIERIPDAGLGKGSSNYGYVTRIREIGAHLYVCGYGGQVFRREASGWIHMDNQLLQKPVDIGSIEDPNELLAALSQSANGTIGLTDINVPARTGHLRSRKRRLRRLLRRHNLGRRAETDGCTPQLYPPGRRRDGLDCGRQRHVAEGQRADRLHRCRSQKSQYGLLFARDPQRASLCRCRRWPL